MKLNQFSITEITLTHDQAIDLKQSVIDAIENFGIDNFNKKKEILLPQDDEDLFDIYVECEIYTEYSGSFQELNEPPQAEIPISRSVISLKIQVVNDEGDEVKIKVLPKREKITGSPIDIEEEIKKHFSI